MQCSGPPPRPRARTNNEAVWELCLKRIVGCRLSVVGEELGEGGVVLAGAGLDAAVPAYCPGIVVGTH